MSLFSDYLKWVANFFVKFRYNSYFFSILFLIFLLCGCNRADKPVKQNDLSFTLVSGTDVPQKLQELLKKQKAKAFELTYSDNKNLYIVKGYGKKPTGGYNLVITDLYEASTELVFSTELYGPKIGELPNDGKPSYPYLIVKLPAQKKQVTFY